MYDITYIWTVLRVHYHVYMNAVHVIGVQGRLYSFVACADGRAV